MRDDLPPEIQEIVKRLKEYYFKTKIDPIEEAEMLNTLVEEPEDHSRRPYMTITEVSNEFRISRGQVYVKISLVALTPELKKAVRDGKIGLWEASGLAKKLAKKAAEDKARALRSGK